MFSFPTLDFKGFSLERDTLAENVLSEIKKKIPSAEYEIQGENIVFILPNKKVNFPVKVINGRFYTNDSNFERYISSDRKSIKYAPYSELFENLNIELG